MIIIDLWFSQVYSLDDTPENRELILSSTGEVDLESNIVRPELQGITDPDSEEFLQADAAWLESFPHTKKLRSVLQVVPPILLGILEEKQVVGFVRLAW